MSVFSRVADFEVLNFCLLNTETESSLQLRSLYRAAHDGNFRVKNYTDEWKYWFISDTTETVAEGMTYRAMVKSRDSCSLLQRNMCVMRT
jgi:hypothetical protein